MRACALRAGGAGALVRAPAGWRRGTARGRGRGSPAQPRAVFTFPPERQVPSCGCAARPDASSAGSRGLASCPCGPGRAEWEHDPAVHVVPDLRGGGVDGEQPGEDALPAGHLLQRVAARPVGEREQEEEQCERREDELERAGRAQRADEHDRREDAPGEEVPAHRPPARLLAEAPVGEHDERDEREPEETVRAERGGAELVALAEVDQPGDHLGEAPVEDPHREDHRVELVVARVVDVEQDRRQAEAHQAERRRVRGRVVDVDLVGRAHASTIARAVGLRHPGER